MLNLLCLEASTDLSPLAPATLVLSREESMMGSLGQVHGISYQETIGGFSVVMQDLASLLRWMVVGGGLASTRLTSLSGLGGILYRL